MVNVLLIQLSIVAPIWIYVTDFGSLNSEIKRTNLRNDEIKIAWDLPTALVRIGSETLNDKKIEHA